METVNTSQIKNGMGLSRHQGKAGVGLAGRGGWGCLKGLWKLQHSQQKEWQLEIQSLGLDQSQELRGHLEGQGGNSGPPPPHSLLGFGAGMGCRPMEVV